MATIIIAFFTATLSAATKGMLCLSAEQSKAMERSIREATRSANAMENVAKKQENAIEIQMRAYLTVIIGRGFYQEREKNIKFSAEPLIVNTGHTPAHNVTFKIKTDILPFPLPSDFEFSSPQENKGESIIGPHNNATISDTIKELADEAEVNDIKYLKKDKALYVWGEVNYIDVFGKKRETKFAQLIYWIFDETPHGIMKGLYLPGHNKVT